MRPSYLLIVLVSCLLDAVPAVEIPPWKPPLVGVVLTPDPPATPRITGPRVIGAGPGRDFLYRIPATGTRPMAFGVAGLPAGLTLDADSGIIRGIAPPVGTHRLAITARNSDGGTEATIDLIIGQGLALTPTMGWNSWNGHGANISDKLIRAAADTLVDSGLADHGYSYINIDDGWEGTRAEDGTIRGNERFPDMKALCDYIHAKGLKVGIHSSPGPLTCRGFLGSWQHEEQDARTYAAWGIDFLKYDWCTYPVVKRVKTLEDMQHPHRLMAQALARTERDIVYNLCQWGLNSVWEWGREVGGHSWRIAPSIKDDWASMTRVGFSQDAQAAFAGPGGWNDPDMLVVGHVGWGFAPHPSLLTPDEQYTHITLWCMLAAPLIVGCDLSKLDRFTLNLLGNDEVLAVDQDRLGRQGRRLSADGTKEVWLKPLADGTVAVALFNRGEEPATVAVTWSALERSGAQAVRDLWRQADLGSFDGGYETLVAPHGAALVRVGVGEPQR